MNIFRYYIKDALQGMKRNSKAFFATVLLIAISLSLMGAFFLVKVSSADVVLFLETQVKIKVFLKEGADVKKVNDEIQSLTNVQGTEVESKKEMLQRMKGMFKGKDYLFEAFQETSFPHTILIEAKDENKVEETADKVKEIHGIQDVVYPQTFAKHVLKWTDALNKNGIVLLIVFLIVSFLTTQLAISLSIFQRQQEIKIKLLLGAKQSHVRSQFLFEGWMMAFVGSILACILVFAVQQTVIQKLYTAFPYVFQDVQHPFINVVLLLVGIGSVVGIFAAYVATKRMIKAI